MSPENLNKLIYNIAFINEDIKTLQERLPPNQNVDEYSQYSKIGWPRGNLSLKSSFDLCQQKILLIISICSVKKYERFKISYKKLNCGDANFT